MIPRSQAPALERTGRKLRFLCLLAAGENSGDPRRGGASGTGVPGQEPGNKKTTGN